MISLVSSEANAYQDWQVRLLARSHRDVGQTGTLLCLRAGGDGPFPGIETVPCLNVSHHPLTGDHYPPYNKPASFCSYFSSHREEDRTYLLLDPDMVFTRSWSPTITPREGIGEDTLYMRPDRDPGPAVVSRHCRRNPDRVQAVGFPVVIHESSLRAIVDRWHILTEEMRGDPRTRTRVGWVCEMFAFTIAAAEADVRFRVERNCSFLHDAFDDKPLIHYTYGLNTRLGFRWDKRDHRAGESLPPLTGDVPRAGRQFHRILSDFTENEHARGNSARPPNW